jgi:hypothetical protein
VCSGLNTTHMIIQMVPQSDLNCAMTTPNRALIKKHNWDSDCIEHLSCKEQKDFWWNYHSCRGCKAELLIGLLRWLWRYSNIEEDLRKKRHFCCTGSRTDPRIH